MEEHWDLHDALTPDRYADVIAIVEGMTVMAKKDIINKMSSMTIFALR